MYQFLSASSFLECTPQKASRLPEPSEDRRVSEKELCKKQRHLSPLTKASLNYTQKALNKKAVLKMVSDMAMPFYSKHRNGQWSANRKRCPRRNHRD